MLLIVGCPGYPRNNSKARAQAIVRAIDCIGDPTAPSPMPAFAFQDFVQGGARTNGRRHGAKRSRMRFFLKRAFPQEFLPVLFIRESGLSMFMKFGLLPFLRRPHSANGNGGPGNSVPP